MLRKYAVYLSATVAVGFVLPSAVMAAPMSQPSSYLYVWSSDADMAEGDHDFLSAIDVNENSPTYGQVVSTTPVGEVGTMAHHIEPKLGSTNQLFASGFMANIVYLFDMNNKETPTLVKTIPAIEGYAMSHSFIRTPDHKVLATLQYTMGSDTASGGLALFEPDGSLAKTVNASASVTGDVPVRSYGVDVLPEIDRIVTTSTPMDMDAAFANVAQVWRLSDMKLLHTLSVVGPDNAPMRGKFPFEIRVLPDGKSAMFNTFSCGFYLIDGLETDNPTVELVYAMKKMDQQRCAVPSIVGNYWVMPVEKSGEVVVLDISDPRNTHEVFTLKFDEGFFPHYSVNEPKSNRIALVGFMGMDHRVLMIKIDEETGALSWDEKFREAGSDRLGVDYDRASWPHGDAGDAIPHGMVWSNP